MSWLEKISKLLCIADFGSDGPQQSYSLTELKHPIVDDEDAEGKTGDTEVSPAREVHVDKQLNSEPHVDTNDKIQELFLEENHLPHLFFPDINVNDDSKAVGVGYPGYDISGETQKNENNRKINLTSVGSSSITIDELAVENPTLAKYLSSFGVMLVDKNVVSAKYAKLCVKAARQEKPVSEFLKHD